MGRPTKYSKSLCAKICHTLETGHLNIEQTCESVGITCETFYAWRWAKADFSEAVARALKRHYEVIGERLLDYAEQNVIVGDKSDNARARVHDTRIKARQWFLSKIMPATYGDKLDITADVTFNVPSIITPAPIQPALKPGQQHKLPSSPQDVVVESQVTNNQSVSD